MDVASSTCSGKYVSNPQLVSQFSEKPPETPKIISDFVSDLLAVAKSPIERVINRKEPKQVIHIVKDPVLQKKIQEYHRYGPEHKSRCPFTGGQLLQKFTQVFPEKNILTLHEGQNDEIRNTLQRYLNLNYKALEQRFTQIADAWVKNRVGQGPIKLFEAVNLLTSECIIKGIMGYNPCTTEEIKTNALIWKELLSPLPSELVHVGDHEKVYLSILPQWINNLYHDFGTYKSQIGAYNKLSEITALADKIIGYATNNDQVSLYSYLFRSKVDPKLLPGTIKSFFVFGETLSYFLGYLLYEYSSRPEMQTEHLSELLQIENNKEDYIQLSTSLKEKKSGCYSAYLEALRMYPTGGSTRQAGEDLILSYTEVNNDISADKSHVIKTGDMVVCVPYAAGHDGDVWENPEQFNPYRANLQEVRSKVLPFGSGAHACIGEKTAEQIALIVLSAVLKYAKLEKKQDLPELIDATVLKPIHDIDIEFKTLDH